jgi:MFS family permease
LAENWRNPDHGGTDQTLRHGLNTPFASLRNPNFRLYLAAQVGSNIGAWIQITAENWLVLQLTDSGLSLGITNALQFGPLVFFGLYGGVIADRFDRRRLLIVTQSALALLATAIGLLVATHLIQLWMIWLAALLLGLIIAVDKPALLTFVKDLVGEADLANAVALNNAVISSGRMIGPAVSGFLIASFGMAPSFFVNAVSFGLVVLVLVILDVARLHVTRPVERKPGQVREGLSYIWQDRVLTLTVIAMSVVFVAAYNFQVFGAALNIPRAGRVERTLWYGDVVLGFGRRRRFLADCVTGETGSDDGRAMVRAAGHRSSLAGFAVWGSFRTCRCVFAGPVQWAFQRYGRQHPTAQSSRRPARTRDGHV